MMEKKEMSRFVLVGITAIAVYACYLLFRPYITPVLFACVVGIIFYPLHRLVQKRIRRPNLSAAISTLITFLLTAVPLAFLLFAISNELTSTYQNVAAKNGGAGGMSARFLQAGEKIVSWINIHFHVPNIDLRSILISRLETASASMLRLGATLVGNLFSFIANATIALIILFFVFRDGPSTVSGFMKILLLGEKQARELQTRISSAVTANFYGGALVGGLQGVLTGLSFWVLGMDSPVLWGITAAVFSLVPMVGTAIVWLPASIVLLLAGNFVKAAILLALGAGLISTVDNMVRPFIVYKALRLHPLFVFFSIIGGIQLFGVLGLFVGPVILAVAAALLQMLHEEMVPSGDQTISRVEQFTPTR